MKEKTITYTGVAVIAILLISNVFAFVSNSRKKRDLNAEKLHTESLLSEKLLVEKELDKLKADFSALKVSSEENDKLLAETESKLAGSEKRIVALSGTNISLKKDKKALEELHEEKAELDRQFADLKKNHDELLLTSDKMKSSITELESQKNELVQELQILETYSTDNFSVYGSRGKKDKLTFRACRTKKMNVNFDVPQKLTETLSFEIVTPAGTVITPDDKALALTILRDSPNFTASLSSLSGEFEQSRQVSLTYNLKERLSAGEYKVRVLCDKKNIGNCRIRLK